MSERAAAVLFASVPPHLAPRALARAQAQWPGHAWTVCVKERERGWVPADCRAIVVPRWRPSTQACRALGAGTFAVSVFVDAAVTGYARLAALHVRTPARQRYRYRLEGDSFELDPQDGRPRSSLRVAAGALQSAGVIRPLVRLYACTLGPVFGAVFLWTRHALLTLRR
jgi:hypothetical protein